MSVGESRDVDKGEAMLVKKRSIRNGLIVFLVVTLVSASTLAYLATRRVSDDDSRFLIASKLISKALIMRVFDQVESNFNSDTYSPTPFDSPDFAYADL